MSDDRPGELDVAMTRPATRGGVSLVWLVPFVAIAISLFMAWQAFSSRGPLIDIVFENAEGVDAGETELRFRDVRVGMVEEVRFSDSLTDVVVSVRLQKDMARFVDADAAFWIVRPEVSAQGISGLGTLLGGVYLEGSWDDREGTPVTRFTGLEQPPFITGNMRGVQFTLAASSAGTIEPGAPIIYKGVSVGVIDRPRLTADGSAVTARAFVRAPYDQLVTDATRFWGVSGVSVNLGLDGVSIEVANLSALVQGGITFDTFGEPGGPVGPDNVFTVYASREDAGSLVIADLEGPQVPFSVLFDNSIAGLSPGAPVNYRGLTIGSVTGTGAVVREGPDGSRVLPRADIGIVPDRLGITGSDFEARTEELFAALVADGFRARLASRGLLGTAREIQIVAVEDAAPAELDRSDQGRPVLPSTAPVVTDAAATARTAFARIEDIPIERIAASVADLVDSITQVVASDGVQAAPAEITGLVRDLRETVGGDEVARAITEAGDAAERIDGLLAQLEEGEAALRLTRVLDRTAAIAANVEGASARAPEIAAEVGTLLATVNDLPLAGLVEEAQQAAAGAATLLAREAVAGLPDQLAAILNEAEAAAGDLRSVTGQVRDSDAIPSVLAALARSDAVAEELQQTLRDVPALLEELEGLVAEARALPLGQLGAEATRLTASANALLSSEAAQALPAEVAAVLDDIAAAAEEMRGATVTLDEAGSVEALAAALARSDAIAASLEDSAAALPAILSDAGDVAAQVRDLPFDDLTRSAAEAALALEGILAAPGARDLPAQLQATLAEAERATAQVGALGATLREGGGAEALSAALARSDRIAASLETAAADLPTLLERIDAFAAQAEALPLDTLVTSARDLVVTAEGLLASDEVGEIPPALATALSELSAVLADLRDGGAVDNTNAALASARDAADAIAAAADALPELSANLDALIVEADRVLGGYGARSEFNAQTLATLQDLRETARAVTSLARTIERKPNALLIGR